jgi:hypothetical protein
MFPDSCHPIQEAKKTFVRGGEPVVLVSYESAVESLDNEKVIQADENHSSIAKMTKHQGSLYPVIRAIIEQSLMSTAQVKAALDRNERHVKVRSV